MCATDARKLTRGAFVMRALFHLPNPPNEICLLCFVFDSPDDESCTDEGGRGAGVGGGVVE